MMTPQIAIVEPNTLAAIGLRQLLQEVMPMLQVDVYGSLSELMANHPENYAHYFVATNIIIANRQFFQERQRKTIALSMSLDGNGQLAEFNSLCVNVPEKMLVRSLLLLEQRGHGHGGYGQPPMPEAAQRSPLTNREIEVMSLIVQGLLNKEIADRLNIGLTTVITHRKNLMEKLGIKSVGALTIYAVMHGYVDINSI